MGAAERSGRLLPKAGEHCDRLSRTFRAPSAGQWRLDEGHHVAPQQLESHPTVHLRLMILSRSVWPSMAPLLQGVVTDNFTVSRSGPSVLTKCATKLNPESTGRSINGLLGQWARKLGEGPGLKALSIRSPR